MFKQLFGGKSSVTLSKLPMLHTFVDVMVGGRPARQVTVESVGPKGIVTKEALGKVGETAVIVYQAKTGRYRAQTKIGSVGAGTTQFEAPRKVSLIGGAPSGAGKRQSVRLDTIVTGTWRFAPGGVGKGEFVKATIRDVSRGGCSLIIDRALKLGTQVEVQLPLKDSTDPLTMLGEVMRHEQIKTSGKHSHGLRFHGIRPGEDQAIVEFINRKQSELRSRGLA
jgi:hypothetical protein